MRPQPRLDVPHGYLLIEGSHGGGHRRGSVTMHKHDVRMSLLQHIAHLEQHLSRHVVKVLSLAHDVEVILRTDAEDAEHLVEHLTVLAGHADYRLEVFGVVLEGLHQWCHLDGFRPCAEDEHHFLHKRKELGRGQMLWQSSTTLPLSLSQWFCMCLCFTMMTTMSTSFRKRSKSPYWLSANR